jgi:hypothetical protein
MSSYVGYIPGICHDYKLSGFPDVLHLRYRKSISKVLDIEGLIVRYRRFESPAFDIKSITGSPTSRFHDFEIEPTHFDIVC